MSDPPEGLELYSPEQTAILGEKLRAAGKPALSQDAVAVETGIPRFISIVMGAFLVLWLCGWYGGAVAPIKKLFTEGLYGNAGSIFTILIFGGLGLLPIRFFGVFLFTRTVLMFEPKRLRVRRQYPLFRRDWHFNHSKIVGFTWRHKVLGILTTIELIPVNGAPLILLEDQDKSPKLRWLARVLREDMGLEELTKR